MRARILAGLVSCAAAALSAGLPAQTTQLPPLPEAVSSFGTVVAGGWLYVYGGHVGATHSYSTATISGRFHRRSLTGGTPWEVLPSGPALQGLNLVTHGDFVYRAGGMKAMNAPGQPSDTVSVADVARFEPAAGLWRQMPSLPSPRSSHDAVVIGDALYVVGGWALREGDGMEWHREMAVLDLAMAAPRWVSVPQPFARRALAAAAVGGRIYVLGGFDQDDRVSARVDIYDTDTRQWSRGPDLPGGSANGFGPAACAHEGRLYLALADGSLHRLTPDGVEWEGVGRFAPRSVMRIAGDGSRILVLGGTGGRLMTDLVEAVPVGPPRETPDPRTWPAFRGSGTSQTAARELPTTWSDTAGIAWRTALDGRGQSSPIVWNDAIYVTAVAGAEKETLLISRVALGDGRVVWRREFAAARKLADTDTTSKAAPTPVVDALGVYAAFESGDLIALTPDGDFRWRRSLMDDYGDIRIGHQYGSSPAIVPGSVIVFVGHAGPSYLLSVDTSNGRTRWKADRPSVTSWNSPIVGGRGDDAWVAVPTKTGLDAHRLGDGELLWSRQGVVPAPMATSTLAGDGLFVPSSTRGGSGAVATNRDGPAWVSDEPTADFASPLIVDGMALFVNPVGVLYATDAANGAVLWRHRLTGANWASPIFDGRHAYFFGVEGGTVVLEPSRDGPRVVAQNSLSIQGRVYGVAAVDGALLMRSDRSLVRISPAHR